MFRSRPPRMTEDRAEALALQVLTFVVSDPEQIARFLSLTGTTPQDLRDVADSRELQIATLEYILSDEGLLLTFCQQCGVDPATVGPAHQLLAGPTDF